MHLHCFCPTTERSGGIRMAKAFQTLMAIEFDVNRCGGNEL
jgi:hypothetical protein